MFGLELLSCEKPLPAGFSEPNGTVERVISLYFSLFNRAEKGSHKTDSTASFFVSTQFSNEF